MAIIRQASSYVMIDVDILETDLSMIEKYVYMVIQIMEQSGQDLTLESIVLKTDFTINQVSTAIENLNKSGWVEGGESV